jgi:hypothetical protein
MENGSLTGLCSPVSWNRGSRGFFSFFSLFFTFSNSSLPSTASGGTSSPSASILASLASLVFRALLFFFFFGLSVDLAAGFSAFVALVGESSIAVVSPSASESCPG